MKPIAPLLTWTTEIETDDGGPLTAVNRVWRDDDARRCRLCDKCVRVDFAGQSTSACTVVVAHPVDPDSAPGFSLRC